MNNTKKLKRRVDGILLVDKPTGMSSNAVLQRVKHMYAAQKAGHTGSLDPLATGMLPICLGEATKYSQFLLDSDKVYQVTARLGIKTNSGDSEGEVIAEKAVPHCNTLELETLLAAFRGRILQVPPMFSALKHQGKPLYHYARDGVNIERAAREVEIYALELLGFSGEQLELKVHCSKGTYIRTLVEDIGDRLGCGAHVTALRRLSVAAYTEGMYTLEQLQAIAERGVDAMDSVLLPAHRALQNMPEVMLTEGDARLLRNGRAIVRQDCQLIGLVCLMSLERGFLGIGEIVREGEIKPKRLVSDSEAVIPHVMRDPVI